METIPKLTILGVLALGSGAAVICRWMIRMPMKENTRYALYMAVPNDEIYRNELERNHVEGEIIRFPPKVETLQEWYHLHLQMNHKKTVKRFRRKPQR